MTLIEDILEVPSDCVVDSVIPKKEVFEAADLKNKDKRKKLIKEFISSNELKTAGDVEDALKNLFKDTLQELLKTNKDKIEKNKEKINEYQEKYKGQGKIRKSD